MSNAVNAWRGTYTPKYYASSGGLESMYKMILNEKICRVDYGAEYTNSGYRSSQSVFKIVFQEGYHGGYWRVPLNVWKYRSPNPTAQGPSILESVENNIDVIWDSEVVPKIREIEKKVFSNYGLF